MDFRPTAAQAELIEATRRICEGKLLPLAKDAESVEGMARLRTAMAEHGLLGLNIPQELGGMGLPLLDTVLLIQAIQSVSSAAGGLAHRSSTGAVGAVVELGTAEQKARFVAPVARGEAGISIGITEPDAGSAATALATRAHFDGDDVVINGRKIFITFVNHNHYTLVYCRFGTSGKAGDIGAVLVPHDAKGFTASAGTLNMAGERQFELYFDDCRVPRANVIADGDAFAKLISVYNSERLGSVARLLGSAQASFEFALRYSRERKQFGREISDFQGIQWMLADMKVKLEAAQLLTYRAAANAGSGMPSPFETSMAKVYAAQATKEICDDAIQILGGYGYMTEFPVEQRYREVRGGSIFGGTLQIHKNMIAGHLLGIPNSQWKRGEKPRKGASE